MATAEEKQARQDAIDAARAASTVGRQRLQTEIGRAAAAFPARRLRTAGDLSRYAIGGYLSDPNAPLPTAKPPATGGGSGPRPVPTASTPSRATGSGVSKPRSTAPISTRDNRVISPGIKPTGAARSGTAASLLATGRATASSAFEARAKAEAASRARSSGISSAANRVISPGKKPTGAARKTKPRAVVRRTGPTIVSRTTSRAL